MGILWQSLLQIAVFGVATCDQFLSIDYQIWFFSFFPCYCLKMVTVNE